MAFSLKDALLQIKCKLCQRYYHFKTFCIEDEMRDQDNGQEFSCRLCRIDFWVHVKKLYFYIKFVPSV